MFNNKYFSKRCDNCAYQSRIFFGLFRGGKCTLSGFYCTVERSTPSICGQNYENWKPTRKAFKEIKRLKKEYPQYFI